MQLSTRAVALSLMALPVFSAWADFDGPAPVAWRWAESTSVPPVGEPQLDGNKIYVAVGGRIYCINRTTGNTEWRYPVGEPISGNFRQGCVLGNGIIVATSDDKSVYAVKTDGSLAWQHLNTDAISTNSVVVGNTVVFGTIKSELMALDTATGNPVWSKPVAVEAGLLPKIGAMDTNVIYSTQRGSLVSLNPVTQRQNWETKFSRLSAAGSYTVFGDRVYVNSGNYLTCLRGFNGGKLWEQNVGTLLDMAPAAYVDGVATIGRDGKLYTYNLTGRPLFPKGVDLQAAAAAAPVFVGKMVCTVMTNGTVNLINPLTGDAVWNYTMASPVKPEPTSSGGGGGGGGGGLAGAGAGGVGGGQGAQPTKTVDYTLAAGSAVSIGDSLAVMTRDGSVLLFDKTLGVDMTSPDVELVWPAPGNATAGKAPMEILFKAEDSGVGINPSTVKVTIDGKEYIAEFLREGYMSLKITVATVNKPLDNGRKKVVLQVADWLGNKTTKEISLVIDNSLPALGSPKKTDSGAGGPGGGGGRAGAGGGGLGGDGGRR